MSTPIGGATGSTNPLKPKQVGGNKYRDTVEKFKPTASKTGVADKARDAKSRAKEAAEKIRAERAMRANGNYEDYLSGDNRDAYMVLKNLFTSYGLPSLAPKIYDYIVKGYSADTISILLQDSKEYKERFAANEDRKKAGLPVLSPAEYLQTETSYRQLMRQAGLPEGFYDQPSDFNQFLAKDVSPTEVQSRVELASQATALASPSYRKALSDLYGIGDSEMTAYFLDPDRALPLLQKQAAASAIGAEAYKRGLATDKSRLEEYASAGISAQQAGQIYSTIAEQQAGLKQAAGAFNENLSTEEIEQGLFQPGTPGAGGEAASAKLTRLQSWQRARQAGQAGTAQQGLARRSQ